MTTAAGAAGVARAIARDRIELGRRWPLSAVMEGFGRRRPRAEGNLPRAARSVGQRRSGRDHAPLWRARLTSTRRPGRGTTRLLPFADVTRTKIIQSTSNRPGSVDVSIRYKALS